MESFINLPVFLSGLIQGMTEFFPVSSSAHFILLQQWMGGPLDEAWDVFMHLGTLLVVMWVFRSKIIDYMGHLSHMFLPQCPTAHEIKCIIVTTLPAIVLGMCVHRFLGEGWRHHMILMGACSILFGLLLGWADLRPGPMRSLKKLTLKHSLIIGLFQALAVFPGVSRSGGCLTGLRLLGYERYESVRWTFLLSLPTVVGAAVLKAPVLQHTQHSFLSLGWGLGISFLSGLACIYAMLWWVKRHSLAIFVGYRLLLGAALLAYGLYGG